MRSSTRPETIYTANGSSCSSNARRSSTDMQASRTRHCTIITGCGVIVGAVLVRLRLSSERPFHSACSLCVFVLLGKRKGQNCGGDCCCLAGCFVDVCELCVRVCVAIVMMMMMMTVYTRWQSIPKQVVTTAIIPNKTVHVVTIPTWNSCIAELLENRKGRHKIQSAQRVQAH